MIPITPAIQNFIVRWGEMGTHWGISRTVAQIYALLYISPDALTAEEIAHTLKIARSNVSTSLKELKSWEVIKVVHKFADRREHFEVLKDVWETFRLILNQRKKREIDTTLAILKDCLAQAEQKGTDKYAKAQLTEFLAFFETVSLWYDQLQELPIEKILGLIQLKNKLTRKT